MSLRPILRTSSPEPAAPKPRLLDQVRQACRVRHYSLRTEDAYVQWIRRFILFHGNEVRQILDFLEGTYRSWRCCSTAPASDSSSACGCG